MGMLETLCASFLTGFFLWSRRPGCLLSRRTHSSSSSQEKTLSSHQLQVGILGKDQRRDRASGSHEVGSSEASRAEVLYEGLGPLWKARGLVQARLPTASGRAFPTRWGLKGGIRN